MIYYGQVHDGRIVLDGDVSLPEGVRVRVDVSTTVTTTNGEQQPTLHERLAPLIGSLTDAPADLASNHDHYLYGTPKRP